MMKLVIRVLAFVFPHKTTTAFNMHDFINVSPILWGLFASAII